MRESVNPEPEGRGFHAAQKRKFPSRAALSWTLILTPVFLLSIALIPPAFSAHPDSISPSSGSPLREVIVVFKTHFDIGYTDMASAIVERYRTSMIDQALSVVDLSRAQPQARRFIWTLPGWPLAQIASDWPGQSPGRLDRIRRAIRDGLFAVHALPFTTHTELLEPEDLVRGLDFSSRLSREAGLPLPRDAKMTDVPSHSWILPALLRGAGVDFLHLGCNAASRSPLVPPIFWWEGPDGSRLLTMYSSAGYGTGLVPPPDWPHRTWLALIHTGDNEGPPKPEDVEKLFAEAAAKIPGVKVRIGRLSDFADSLLAEKPDLPVVRGDMPDTWIHGPMSDPAGTMLARNVRPSIGSAEALDTLLRVWGASSQGSSDAIARAYEQSLLYGEHTWGGALYWVTEYGPKTNWGYGETWKADRSRGRFRRLEASWAEHTAYIEKARDLVAPILTGDLSILAGAVRTSGQRIVVFNPLPWVRDGFVEFGQEEVGSTDVKALGPAEIGDGEAVAVERLGERMRFYARDIPPLGYRVYVPVAETAFIGLPGSEAPQAIIQNERFRVSLDPERGAIQSIIDRSSGRELIDAPSGPGFGQYLYQRFDADQVAAFLKSYVKIDADWAIAELGKPNLPPASQVPYRAASPMGFCLDISRTPLAETAVMRAQASSGVPHALTTRVILPVGAPFIDLEVTLQEKPADAWPEAGWLALPFKVEAPRFLLGRLGSIVDPSADVVPGANRHLFAVNTGVVLIDPRGRGIGLCALDNPLVSLDTLGAWKDSLEFIPKKPVVFVQLFNNQWTTNFRFWNEGTWTARVRIWAFDHYDAAHSLITPSLEARYPLRAAGAEGPGGRLPPVGQGIGVSSPGTLVTAFGPNPDGQGTILRLWELAGRSGSCTVHLPKGMAVRSVRPVDLRGRPAGDPIPVRGGRFAFIQRALAPASFLLRP